VHNAVDATAFVPRDRAQVRAELGWPVDVPVLLFAAESLDNPFKDFRLLLEALGGLSPERRAVTALAVLGTSSGLGESVAGMRTMALGYQEDERALARFYAAADVFVYPTRADNQPRVLLEAMACGCPPVATDVGGVSELVVDGQTGMLTRGGDAEDLRRGIETMLDDSEERVRMGKNGRRLVEERHGMERHLEAMLEVYAAALRDGVEGGAP
jgi:glycosyltransferase involved in cell wall biosynthesis